MIISYNWLSQYLSATVPVTELVLLLTDIGLEVESCDKVQAVKGGLEGVVVGVVVSKDKHPDADKLSVTTVDIGAEKLLQIVCGAPNVAAGQKVAVATIGATIYPSSGDPLTMKRAKIRGIESEGMICAEDELGLGASHAGIMVLHETATVGMPAAQYFELTDDYIIEIGLTPNRSDAQSHIGVAQDVAAAFTAKGTPTQVVLPTKTALAYAQKLPINVTISKDVNSAEACARYAGVVLTGVQVAESPKWLRERLLAVGVRPINNIVDITNFVLHEYGQPLHAFDYEKIEESTVSVQYLPKGTPFIALDDQKYELHEADLMICDGNGKGMCIAGVFGGSESGISDETTTIFLESAYFDAKSVRRTATRHNLRTDASRTFEKGIDPNGVLNALERAAALILELAGGSVASEKIDIYPQPIQPAQVTVRYAQINRLIGNDLAPETVKTILTALNIATIKATETDLLLAIPTNKSDVTREADVIEEILRIYGFNNIAISSTLKTALTPADQPDSYRLRNRVADALTAQGFTEIMALSLTQSRYVTDLLNDSIAAEALVYIHNTSNKGLDIMRPTLLFGALESALRNQNRQNGDLKIYEFGKRYLRDSEDTRETLCLSILLTGAQNGENWHTNTTDKVSFYSLKATVENTLMRLVPSFGSIQATPMTADARFAYGVTLHRGAQIIAEYGRLHTAITKKMELKQEVFYAEINWESVLKMVAKAKTKFMELPKFPTVRRDLALIVDATLSYSKIEHIARKEGKKLLQSVNLFDVYVNEQHAAAGKKSYSVSFVFQDVEKTLKDSDIDAMMQKLIAAFDKEIGAVVRA